MKNIFSQSFSSLNSSLIYPQVFSHRLSGTNLTHSRLPSQLFICCTLVFLWWKEAVTSHVLVTLRPHISPGRRIFTAVIFFCIIHAVARDLNMAKCASKFYRSVQTLETSEKKRTKNFLLPICMCSAVVRSFSLFFSPRRSL